MVRNMRMKTISIALGIALGMVTSALAAEKPGGPLPPASDRKGATFAKDILPIFQKSCVGCHGPEKSKGKIRLDSMEGALKGGDHGKIIQPGNSAKSKLVLAVAGLTQESMPPKGKGDPLTPDQIGLIRAWIDQGAK
jgi:mono/diheme cytochrome c family protein